MLGQVISFESKVALVVGATSGIGAATAERPAALGALSIVSGRRRPEGEQVVAGIERYGPVSELDADDFDAVDATKLRGSFLASSTRSPRSPAPGAGWRARGCRRRGRLPLLRHRRLHHRRRLPVDGGWGISPSL